MSRIVRTPAPAVTALSDQQISDRHAEAMALSREYRSDGWSVRLISGGLWFAASRPGSKPRYARNAAELRVLLGGP